jgi:spore maturation protein B
LLESSGADSFVSACASVIMGSSDTAIYVMSLYFSSVGVKKTRYALPVSLFLMLFCIFFSCFLVRLCLN